MLKIIDGRRCLLISTQAKVQEVYAQICWGTSDLSHGIHQYFRLAENGAPHREVIAIAVLPKAAVF